MGLVYSGCECLIEKHRAKHDIWNAPLAGCAAGGIMAAPGGCLGGPNGLCRAGRGGRAWGVGGVGEETATGSCAAVLLCSTCARPSASSCAPSNGSAAA